MAIANAGVKFIIKQLKLLALLKPDNWNSVFSLLGGNDLKTTFQKISLFVSPWGQTDRKERKESGLHEWCHNNWHQQWQECFSPIADAAQALTSYHSLISLFSPPSSLYSSPTRSIPLASRSVSLCYLKPAILPLTEPLCCIYLPLRLCVRVCVSASVYMCMRKEGKKPGSQWES